MTRLFASRRESNKSIAVAKPLLVPHRCFSFQAGIFKKPGEEYFLLSPDGVYRMVIFQETIIIILKVFKTNAQPFN